MTNLRELVAQCGVELYDTEAANENGRAIWRVYITKKCGGNSENDDGENGAKNGGNVGKNDGASKNESKGVSKSVSLEDCEKVSRLLSPIYDAMPPLNGEWILEVSSPGIERNLSKFEHFKASLGEMVKITLNDKAVISGEIKGVDEPNLEINLKNAQIQKEAKNGENLEIKNGELKVKFDDIKKARTYIEW